MNNKQIKNDKYEYLVVNKKITNAMMGNNANSYFNNEEIGDLKKQKSIHKIGFIESNQFPIEASNFGDLAFSTQLFFESIPDEFLDVNSEKFAWKPGENKLPVILSQDFLNLYNFGFALSQGLPQMSEETIQALSFNITIGNRESYLAEIVGFSQRYSSVIVPLEFMNYANQKYGSGNAVPYSRLILQTEEADNPELVKYLQEKNYSTQNDKIKWSKIKTIVQIVFASSGFLGFFILILCMMMILLYLNLMITRSAKKLQLLSMLGYQTKVLQKQFTTGIFISFILSIAGALILALITKIGLSTYLASFQILLSKMLSWPVWILAILLCAGLYLFINIRSKKIIQQYLA